VTSPVFLDSGIFVAFLNRNDQWHAGAAALFGSGKQPWYTSYLVMSEAYSFILHKYGEESARTLRTFVGNLEGLHIHDANKALHAQTLKLLDRLRGAKVSYVDASSLGILEKHKIKIVWSTDYHLGLTGAEVLPRRSS